MGAGGNEAKVNGLRRGFSETANIDLARLGEAVQEDLMREKLLGWLDEHATITEKSEGEDASTDA